MGKSKLLGLILLVLGIGCIGMYFVFPQESNDYKVVFDSQGGTPVAEQVIKKGEKVVKPEDPTKENSQFVEWQLDGFTYVFDNTVTKNMTLVAKWDETVLRNVKVTLEGNEYTASVKDGDPLTIEELNMPAKEGYSIKLYNENNEEFDITQPVTMDLVLNAQYIEIKMYTVKFDSQKGSKVADVKTAENTTISEPEVIRDGYLLDGWYLGNDKFDFTTPITKDITLKAKWTEKGKINVIFMADEKTYKTVAVKEGTKVTKPANPTKKGYKFVEWQLNGAAFDFNTSIIEETTLTAVFEEAKSYTVSFDSDGGSKIKDQEVEAGNKASKPTAPTKTGYVFKEWQLNGTAYDFNSEVNDDIALKATWEKEKAKYTVKFVDEFGKELAPSQTVTEGEKASKPTDPTKEGYTFSEWLLDRGTYDFSAPIVKDIELVAFFKKVQQATPTPEPTPTTSPAAVPNAGDVNESSAEEGK